MPAPPEPAVLPEPDPAVRERPRHALVPDRPRGPFPTLAERFPASDPGVVDGMTRVADTRTVDYPLAQLQEKYASHGEIFGLTDPANPARIAEFRAAIDAHIHDPGTIPYAGTYHGASVIEFYNPTTGIDVLVLPNGEFLSCWRVSEGQADRIARLTPL